MKILGFIALGLTFLLSLSAGAAKIMQLPQEAAFFQQAGLGTGALLALGAAQTLAAGLLIFKRSRALGAIIAVFSFFISAGIILKTGDVQFAAVSLIPVAIALFVAMQSRKRTEA